MDECGVFLRGEIDLTNVAEIIGQMQAAATRSDGEVVVDCCDLTFIDMAGINALLGAQRALVDQGRDLRLVHPSPPLTRVLHAVGLTELLSPDRGLEPAAQASGTSSWEVGHGD